MVGRSRSLPAPGRPSSHKCLPGGSQPELPAAKDSVWLLLSEPQAGGCPARALSPPSPCGPASPPSPSARSLAGHAPTRPVAAGNEAAPQPSQQPVPPAPGDVLYELLRYIRTQRQALVCGPFFGRAFGRTMPRGHGPRPLEGEVLSALLASSRPGAACTASLFLFLLISPWKPFLSVSRDLNLGVTPAAHCDLSQPPPSGLSCSPNPSLGF